MPRSARRPRPLAARLLPGLLCLLLTMAPARAQQGANAEGFPTARGGSPFETVRLELFEMGPVFDSEQREVALYALANDVAGRAQGGVRLKADIPAGLLGLTSGAKALTGGVVLEGSAQSTVSYDGDFLIASDTLPDGAPVTLRFIVRVSKTETVWHSNAEACAPQRSTNSATVSLEVRTAGPAPNRYRETGTRTRTSCITEPTFSGLIDAQLVNPEDTLWATGSSEVALNATVGSVVQFDIRFTASASVATQFSGQKGRATFCGTVGFGFSFDEDAELVPLDPMLPTPPPGIDTITPPYIELFTPPDPLKDCPPDINCDTFIDIFDIIEFLALFDAMDPKADWNLDGLFDIFDIIEYLAVFDLECLPIEIG